MKKGNYVYFNVENGATYTPITSVTISAGQGSIINLMDSLKLTSSIEPASASQKTLTWKSSDPEVASVDYNGKVTSHTQGTTTITAVSSDGVTSNELEITVVDTDLDINKFIDKDSVKLLEEAESGASSVMAVPLGSKIIVKEIKVSEANAQYWAYVVSDSGEGWIPYSLLSGMQFDLSGDGSVLNQAVLPKPGGSYIAAYAMLLNNLGVDVSAMDVYKQCGYSVIINHDTIADRNELTSVVLYEGAVVVKGINESLPEDLRTKIIEAYDKYPMGVIVNFLRMDGVAHAMIVAGYDSSTIYFMDQQQRAREVFHLKKQ